MELEVTPRNMNFAKQRSNRMTVRVQRSWASSQRKCSEWPSFLNHDSLASPRFSFAGKLGEAHDVAVVQALQELHFGVHQPAILAALDRISRVRCGSRRSGRSGFRSPAKSEWVNWKSPLNTKLKSQGAGSKSCKKHLLASHGPP